MLGSFVQRRCYNSNPSAKVGVLGGKRGHICDLFVTFCDLINFARKSIKKATKKVANFLVSARKIICFCPR